MTDPFANLPRGHYGAILADPPWSYSVWSKPTQPGTAASQFDTMTDAEIGALPIAGLAAPDAALFVWVVWPKLHEILPLFDMWGFGYKTCAFCWVKADNTQPDMFRAELPARAGMGHWTLANSEPCLLATRGKPKRLNADVRQGIIAPRREHSRKPDGIHERIERLVAGPYLELFARQKRAGWDVWGNQTDKFAPVEPAYDAEANSRGCYDVAIEAMRKKHEQR